MLELVSILADNVPGVLAHVTRTLADADVDLEGFSAVGDTIHILTHDGDAANQALEAADYIASTQAVQAVRVPNRPGGLADLAEELGHADINVTMAFGSGTGADAFLYLLVDDMSRAGPILAKFDPASAKDNPSLRRI